MKNSNATLTYKVSGTTRTFPLWVMGVEQAHMLTVNTAQSRTKKQIYPRSYSPGDIAVKGRCESQEAYQRLALYIRFHQRAILNTPTEHRFARVDIDSPGYQRLLRLSIPTEQLLVRGWIDNFSIQKKGVFEPAPEFNFSFFVVFDSTATDIGISHRIKANYAQSDYAVARKLERERDEQSNKFGVEQDLHPMEDVDQITLDPDDVIFNERRIGGR